MSPVKVVVDPSSRSVTTPVTLRPESSVSRRCTLAPVTNVTLSLDSTGSTQMTCESDLRVQQAWEAIDPVAADADAGPCRSARLDLHEVDSDRQVEGVQPKLLQVVAQLLDAGFVRHRRVGVLLAGRALGRVLSMLAVDQVEVLRLGVIGLQVVVGDRPGRRDPTMVAKLAEVLRAETEQRSAVELGVPADVIVDLGLELVAVPVVPDLLREVLPAYEYRLGLPVVALPWQERSSFQPEHLRAARGEPVPEGPTPGSRPDDDNVVVLVVCHAGSLLERGSRMYRWCL